MPFGVLLTGEAEQDLDDIWESVARARSPADADRLIVSLEKQCSVLSEFPNRGRVLESLSRSTRMYRQLVASPYVILYSVGEGLVVIHCIVHARRDLPKLLAKRLSD